MSFADFQLDLGAPYKFKCLYGISRCGRFLNFRPSGMRKEAQRQLGRTLRDQEQIQFTFRPLSFLDELERQLRAGCWTNSMDEALVFSMPMGSVSRAPSDAGFTRAVLSLLLKYTGFRIRVITQHAFIGTLDWIRYFQAHADRIVVGFAIGGDDREWTNRGVSGTSTPTARLRALHRLQDAGVPTFGMLCPVFPSLLNYGRLEDLIDQHRPQLLEHIWAEPYNDRRVWKVVGPSRETNGLEYRSFNRADADHDYSKSSAFAADLYVRLLSKAKPEGWVGKLRYLIHEEGVTPEDAIIFSGLSGVVLQGPPDPDGTSRNKAFAKLQLQCRACK